MAYEKNFIPLESDPEIFTKLMHDLGAAKSFKFVDVWSLDSDQLSGIRSETHQPIEALVLILPDCPAYEQQKSVPIECDADILWLKQTINNACGLYAILHCVCNMAASQGITPGSFLERFMTEPASNRARFMIDSPDLESIYTQAAVSGSSQPPDTDDEVSHHYICLVKHVGCLYELDGDRSGPIYRDQLGTDEDILCAKVRSVLRMYIDSCPDGTFSLLALTQSTQKFI